MKKTMDYFCSLRLQYGDGVELDKEGSLFLKHYALFAGYKDLYIKGRLYRNVPVFLENNTPGGVRLITVFQLFRIVKTAKKLVEPKLSAHHRQKRMQRAFKLIGTNYDLFSYNCEHYLNHVMTGEPRSAQVNAFYVLGSLVTGFILLNNI